MKRKRANEDSKRGGLRYAAQQLKIKENEIDAVPWQSAQRGAKDAQKMRFWSFVDADAEVVTRTKEGQGVKTEAVD